MINIMLFKSYYKDNYNFYLANNFALQDAHGEIEIDFITN